MESPVYRHISLFVCLLILPACVSWESPDIDGDGVLVADGDCDDLRAEIGPNAAEIWYDGIDQNCDGNDSDQDGDGFDSWQTGGPDCWDDPTAVRENFDVLTTEWNQPTAAEVNPDATEVYYDGVDTNCDTANDFDQDGDGYSTSKHANREGELGDDCVDGSLLDDANDAGFAAIDVNPGVLEDDCYDGTNADCDTDEADTLNTNGEYLSDFDCDNDGWMLEEECDDNDADVEPNDDPDIWYDCVDANCDGNDGDMDGDGYVRDDYAAACPNWQNLSAHSAAGDCWDDTNETPTEFSPINGYSSTTAAQVNPAENTLEIYYDAIDQNCDGESDFDADLDSINTDVYPDRTGTSGEDCNDTNADINPNVNEACGTAYDDDCDGDVNDLGADSCNTFYQDADQDGYGDVGSSVYCHCVAEIDATANIYRSSSTNDDCDDTESTTYPTADEYCDGVNNDCDNETDEDNAVDVLTWYADTDSDTYGDPAVSDIDCYQPTGYVSDNTDCDDSDNTAYPTAPELCDGVDNDCLGDTDEDDATDVLTWYADTDSDNYGDPAVSDIDCYQPTGYVSDNTDCDDSDNTAYPTAPELCDGVDNDCLGDTDEDDATDVLTWYADTDTDGYGNPAVSDIDCYQPTGYVSDNTDCDDGEITTYPTADEYCDTVNNDCDGETDEDHALDASTWYADGDGDDFGDAAVTDIECYQPTGYVADNTDCDDNESTINPDGTEVCDSGDVDEDCDGDSDDDDTSVTGQTTYYIDGDSDGWGDDSSSGTDYCDPPTGVVTDNTDCDDTNSGLVSVTLDADCDGTLTAGDCDDNDDSSTILADDADCDGTLTAADCDDNDDSSTILADDADCDGTLTAADCDDNDDSSTILADDADCDGTLTAADCDDNDDSSTILADDADCDGTLTAADCDDNDDSSTILADDADCDGSITAEDCNDSNATIYPFAGDTYGDSVDSDCDNLDCEADFSGSTYFTVCAPEITNWDTMDAACISAGYHGLASIRSASENTDMQTLVSSTGLWGAAFGATDESVEGDWEWFDGATWSYENFGTAHYGGTTSENCAEFDGSNGTWNDCTCASSGSTTGMACQYRDPCDIDDDGYDSSSSECGGIDCDDNDASSNTVTTDADCDGTLTADDCDDSDSAFGAIADDADCDGTLTAADCDDNDDASTILADDADCDGSITAEDCNDSNATIYPFAGDTYGDSVDSDCDNMDCEADYSGSTYFTVCEGLSQDYTQAEAACIGGGYDGVASILDATEDSDISSLMAAMGSGAAFIGYTDSATEGTFEWSDGSPSSYENWASGEPNDTVGNIDCTAIQSNLSYEWNDAFCNLTAIDFTCSSR
jgi:hypothetical protein